MRKRLLTGCFLLSLTACTFAPKDTGRAYMFALSPALMTRHAPVNTSLIVSLPTAAPELDTYRIALTRDSKQWDYYAGARWSDFLPLLVQDSLTKTLEEARLFKAVTTDQAGVDGDQTLKAEIRTFQAEYTPGYAEPTVKIRIVVSLSKRTEGTTSGPFEIRGETRAAKNKLPDIQAAFALAFNDAQKQLVYKLERTF
ncbi:MAG: membrane integrity-associated transporter subunit PqiC [Proteobacteria bacterium]|nr:membrane integrity-associated transporter subunit PqiC [Pseudomonadota bacterium]